MIADYSELIAEVTQRTGQTDVATRASMFVGMAETMLSKRLRVGDAEATATLTTDADGVVALPADYVAVRTILVDGCELPRRSLRDILERRFRGCTIKGRTLHSSEAEAEHTLHYYARLPSLEANDTNWLLESDPELYLQSVMFQAYSAAGDLERAQITAGYIETLIAGVIEDDNIGRFSRMRLSTGRAIG